MPRYIAELPRLRSSLPDDVWEVIDRHEARGFTGCPEYVAAMVAFYKQHLCRLDPWPEELEYSFAELGEDSYVAMNGPSEFNITGVIKDWDVTGEIQRIDAPVLVLAGRHDELSPEAQQDMAQAFPNGECVILENGAHMPFFDDREAFMAAAREFLSRVEGG
jgi:proline iminopeptidase